MKCPQHAYRRSSARCALPSSMQQRVSRLKSPLDRAILASVSHVGAVMEYGEKMDLILRSLEDIPMHSRLDFAKAVTLVKERILSRGKPDAGG
jgi:hypothetical protein